ncbi:MAG: sortase [Candidatus Woesebacteria bacterium]|jgi:sortase A
MPNLKKNKAHFIFSFLKKRKFKSFFEALLKKIKLLKIPTVLVLLLAVVFLHWILTTFLPVLIVESKYQYQKILINVFHVSDIRGLFLPEFKALNYSGRSKYKDYGIKIPVIFLDEPVVFNVDPNDKQAYKEALKKGIAHASSTAFPDNAGIGYYFAHSSSSELRTQYNAVFYLLGKLKTGDKIYIWHEQKQYQYSVSETKVTQADEVSFLDQFYETETIVLQTCWPPGTTKKRLLVFAKRVD